LAFDLAFELAFELAFDLAFDLAFELAFDLRRPVKPRWPEADIKSGGKPAGRRFSRAGPGMALRGGPPI